METRRINIFSNFWEYVITNYEFILQCIIIIKMVRNAQEIQSNSDLTNLVAGNSNM